MEAPTVEQYGAELVRDNRRDVRAFADRVMQRVLLIEGGVLLGLALLAAATGSAWSVVEWAVLASVLPAGLAVREIERRLGAGRHEMPWAYLGVQAIACWGVSIVARGEPSVMLHAAASLCILMLYRDWRLVAMLAATCAAGWVGSALATGGVAAAVEVLPRCGWLALGASALAVVCRHIGIEMTVTAQRQAALELLNVEFEQRVAERTAELAANAEALKEESDERAKLQTQLHDAQRLESIGQLAAGVAHEINTPVQYVSDNTRFVRDRFADVLRVIDTFSARLDRGAAPADWQERSEAVRRTLSELDYEFLKTEVPRAIEESLEGLDRVTRIVRAMKDFSHPGSTTKQTADINHAIESTSIVCKARWKFVAALKLDLDPELPEVPCLLGELNQVFLNLIVNAADAIMERHGEGSKGLINVSTRRQGNWVEVRVKDNGGGIPPEVQPRIFQPFFTTKEVGKGTGQGLTISRNVVVNKHGGTLEFETEPGEGTTFVIRLPLVESVEAAMKEAA